MRMRRKKHRHERYDDCIDYALTDIGAIKDDFKKLFPNDNEVHLEIGCGKGKFVTEMAVKYPNVNFIAVEKSLDVIIMAMEKAKEMNLTNVKFLAGDVNVLREFNIDSQIQVVYLNFSDPWKKSGQKKRRLTHENFLNLYRQLLVDGGEVHFKTDNRNLFEFSLNSFCNADIKLKNITLDLHSSAFKEENVMTEYETNFVSQGMPIYRLESVFYKNK